MSNKSFIYWGIYNFCPENIAFVTKINSILRPDIFFFCINQSCQKIKVVYIKLILLCAPN